MRRRTLILALACIALAGSQVLAAGSKRSFQLLNKSDFTIAEIAISPAGEDDWSDSFLGEDSLDAGGTAKLAFDEPDAEALYDLMIVDDAGDTHAFQEIPLAKVTKITVLTKDGAMTLKIEQGK
jgi:hypothetical protein